MRISFTLEPTDVNDPVDVDPLGAITLTESDQSLHEPIAYLDTWLDALAEGADRIMRENIVQADLVDEPDPLVFSHAPGGIKISYREKFLVVSDINALIAEVRRAREELQARRILPDYLSTSE